MTSHFIILTDFKGYGGTKSYFWNLLKVLRRRGLPIHVIFAARDAISQEEQLILGKFGVTEVSYWPSFLHSSILKKARIHQFVQFFYLLNLKLRNANSSIAVSTGTPGLFLISSVLWGKRCLYILHTYPHGYSKKHLFLNRIKLFYLKPALKWGFRVLTVSQFAKEEIERCWLDGKPNVGIQFIHNTIRPRKTSEEDRWPARTVVTCGHLEWYKNPEGWLKTAFAVIKKIPLAEFIWIGNGKLEAEMRARVPSSFQQNIKFVGGLNDPSIFIKSAGVYFQPSLVESHGMAVLEAMSYQVPVVVSNAGGLPESVNHGMSGYVVNIKDTEEASSRILDLLANPKKAKEMGKIGYQLFTKKFSFEVWERRMTFVLDEWSTLEQGEK